jgi:hypothetical protein
MGAELRSFVLFFGYTSASHGPTIVWLVNNLRSKYLPCADHFSKNFYMKLLLCPFICKMGVECGSFCSLWGTMKQNIGISQAKQSLPCADHQLLHEASDWPEQSQPQAAQDMGPEHLLLPEAQQPGRGLRQGQAVDPQGMLFSVVARRMSVVKYE